MTEPRNASWLMKGVIPYLVYESADAAVACYQRAFGARMVGDFTRDEAGRVMNVSLEINGGVMMLMDHILEGCDGSLGARPGTTMQLVVGDGQGWWDRAVAAGFVETMPYGLQFWGDYYGRLRDPFGLDWAILEPGAAAMAKHREMSSEVG